MKREVQIMHHLKGHENIVTLIGAFEDRQSVHLVRMLPALSVSSCTYRVDGVDVLAGDGAVLRGRAFRQDCGAGALHVRVAAVHCHVVAA